MKKHVIIGLFCVLLHSCGILLDTRTSQEKAADRKCARAERWLAKATFLCPALLQMSDSARLLVALEITGKDTSGTALWSDTLGDMDVLCEELLARNEQLKRDLRSLDSARIVDNEHAIGLADARVNNTRAAGKRALSDARKKACDFEPIEVKDSLFTLFITPTDKGPTWELRLKPRTVHANVAAPCPPRVSMEPVVLDERTGSGVNGWWLTLCIVFALSDLALFMLWRNEAAKNNQRRAPAQPAQ